MCFLVDFSFPIVYGAHWSDGRGGHQPLPTFQLTPVNRCCNGETPQNGLMWLLTGRCVFCLGPNRLDGKSGIIEVGTKGLCFFLYDLRVPFSAKRIKKGEETMKSCSIILALLTAMGLTSFAQAEDMGPIVSAETKTGAISSAPEIDIFDIDAAAGQTAILRVADHDYSSFTPCIRLHDGPDEVVCCGVDFCEIVHTFQYSPPYEVEVYDNNSGWTGNYGLSLLLIPGATQSQQDQDGGDIFPGEKRQAQLDLHLIWTHIPSSARLMRP